MPELKSAVVRVMACPQLKETPIFDKGTKAKLYSDIDSSNRPVNLFRILFILSCHHTPSSPLPVCNICHIIMLPLIEVGHKMLLF